MRYRKLDPRFWKDERIRTLDPPDKLISIYAFSAQSNRIGCFSFSPGMAAEDTGIPGGTFRKRFRKVCNALSWEWDEAAGVVYIPTWWKYNPPENQNVLIGSLGDLGDVPHSPLVASFSRNLTHLNEDLYGTFRDTLAKRYPQHWENQEQEQYQEQEHIPGAGAVTSTNGQGPVASWPTPEALVELYHASIPPGHPRVTTLTAGRRKKAGTTLAQFSDREFWVTAFAEIARSSFLRGQRPSPGHENFRADFDWLLSKGKDGTENVVKVAEGKYRDATPAPEDDDDDAP